MTFYLTNLRTADTIHPRRRRNIIEGLEIGMDGLSENAGISIAMYITRNRKSTDIAIFYQPLIQSSASAWVFAVG